MRAGADTGRAADDTAQARYAWRVLSVTSLGALGWSNALVVVGVALFVVSLPVFIVTEHRRRYPMLDLSMFSDRERSVDYASSLPMAVARFAVVLLIALVLSLVRNVRQRHSTIAEDARLRSLT